MRIEDISKKALKESPNAYLLDLRERCVQVFSKNFKGNRRKSAGFLKRTVLFENYRMLLDEMKDRNIDVISQAALDRQIFKQGMWGFNISVLGDICLVDNYASIGGDFVRSPRSATSLDILVKASADTKEIINRKLREMATEIQKRTGKEGKVLAEEGDDSTQRIPLYDLILRAKEEMKVEKVEAKAEKTADEIIKANKAGKNKQDGEMEIYVCPNCKNEIEVPVGTPRSDIVCPECDEKGGRVKKDEEQLEDFEYLIHHIATEDGNEDVHHCYLYDHLGNLFEQAHLVVKNGVPYFNEKKVKDGIFHVIAGLEPTQEVVRGDEMAEENGIKSKGMHAGMSLKEKAKVW